MQTFLERAAGHVFQKYSGKLNKTAVILPTNRACFFFKRSLAMQTEEPVWAPQILPIDDFITQAADAELVEPISLLWTLYDVCKEIDPNIQFDRFTAWAHTLLQDFDKIDQYLVDTKQLFSYLSKAKTLERWQPDILPNQLPQSKITDNYFKLWENLDQTYSTLKKRLTEQKKGYRGMMYRWVAENPHILVENPDIDQYIFVGLNALSYAEEKLLKFLVKEKKAEVLWDTDSYYMDKNTEVKAGDLLRKYKNEEKLGIWNWQTDYLLTQPKDIYLVGVPNASMQGKIASQIYLHKLQEKRAGEEASGIDTDALDMTAIVLPDENLLLPVLQSLNPDVEDFNITMGLSLRNSSLFTLINLLFELQHLTFIETKEGKKLPKFNHRNVVKVLTHPFLKHYEQLYLQDSESIEETDPTLPHKNFIRHTLRSITDGNKVYLSPKELFQLGYDQALFKTLFTPWNGEVQKALDCFYQLIHVLRSVYKNQKDAIETEYLYLFYTIVRRLETILKERKEQPGAELLSLRSFKLFLYELFKQTKIPFTGEPVSQLQIMGMLETRTLDFETVIILSVNEKVLPQAKKQNSLIPLDASMEFGLPNYRSQEATMSYHFYRLLQRAKNIYLLHVLPSETYGAGEKSRFIHQIEHELARQNPLIRLHHQTVQTRENEENHEPEAFQIQKTAALQAQMAKDMRKGISPSQMNSYIQCTLQYYFNYLAHITAEEEVEENIGASQFGNIVHKTLEGIDAELSRQHTLIYANDLDRIIETVPERVKCAFEEAYSGYTLENGLNHLLYKVAVRVIRNFLQQQKATNEFPIEILGLEKSLNVSVVFEIDGKPVPVQIYGRIDRIDRVGNTIRVIDYKTGKVEKKHLKIPETEKEEFLLMSPDADKVRQLWLYKYILAKRMLQEKGLRLADRYLHAEDYELISGIFSFRNIKDGLLEVPLRFTDNPEESLEDFVAYSEVYLNKIVALMLAPNQPFERTSRLQACAYCQYRRICDR